MPYEFLLVLVPVLVPAVASIFVAIITARSNRKIAEVQKTIEDQAVNNKQDAELKKLKDMVLGIGQATLVNECRRYVS